MKKYSWILFLKTTTAENGGFYNIFKGMVDSQGEWGNDTYYQISLLGE